MRLLFLEMDPSHWWCWVLEPRGLAPVPRVSVVVTKHLRWVTKQSFLRLTVLEVSVHGWSLCFGPLVRLWWDCVTGTQSQVEEQEVPGVSHPSKDTAPVASRLPTRPCLLKCHSPHCCPRLGSSIHRTLGDTSELNHTFLLPSAYSGLSLSLPCSSQSDLDYIDPCEMSYF